MLPAHKNWQARFQRWIQSPPAKPVMHDETQLIELLNQDCYCISLDPVALKHELETGLATHGLYQDMLDSRPNLFAALPVFVSRPHVKRMEQVIGAVEAVVAQPAYRDSVLAWAPSIARFDPGSPGACLGYDFHLGTQGPQLIEINTNAGGAMLNAYLARAQRACCEAMRTLSVGPIDLAALEQRFLDMFLNEWRLQRGSQPLHSVAIVDNDPQQQFLYPEFVLFQQLFRRHGIDAIITGARELTLRADRLWHGSTPIDLVYNRLTDFGLEQPEHITLRDSYRSGAAVITPHPRAHALYADKRNLTLLTDAQRLNHWGVPEAISSILLSGIPRTVLVTPQNAAALWSNRRRLFFKPAMGYGGKAAYRGDKLTKRVWDEIVAGQYVAQDLAVPSERRLHTGVQDALLKLDVRNYVYDGEVQLLAARLYQGQTTNFRTPGGGFATVFTPSV